MSRCILLGFCFTCLLTQRAEAGRYNVEDYATAYRIQVYETFRTNRGEYERRIALGKEVEQLARATNHPDAQQRLIEWLGAATAASRPGIMATLPPLPNVEPFVAEDLAREQEKQAARARAARKAEAAQVEAAQQARMFPRPDDDPPGLFGRLGRFVGMGRESAPAIATPQPASQAPPALTESNSTAEPWMKDEFWEDRVEHDVSEEASLAAAVKAEVAENAGDDVFADISPEATTEAPRKSMKEHGEEEQTDAPPTATATPTLPADEELQWLNARIARHNLTLENLRARFDAAWQGEGQGLTQLMPRLERLVADHGELVVRRAEAEQAFPQRVIPLDPTEAFLADVASRLRSFQPAIPEGDDQPTISQEALSTWRNEVATWQAVYF